MLVSHVKVALLIFAILIILSLVVAGVSGRRSRKVSETVGHGQSKYMPGQVWEYRTRKGEERSRIHIVRVLSNNKAGDVYSIYVSDIAMRNPHIKGGIQRMLPHAPVDAKSLDSSVVRLLATDGREPDDFAEAYQEWRDEYDKGNAGAFTIPVAEIIQFIEDGAAKASGE